MSKIEITRTCPNLQVYPNMTLDPVGVNSNQPKANVQVKDLTPYSFLRRL